ncbi:MAG: polysaccharide deacetylase family protein [Candidatus Neomarinimicrobiota bacterium]
MVYHKVDEKKEIGITCIPPEKFRKQIQFLTRQGFRLVALSDLEGCYANDPNAIAITFDDGYRNIYEYAFPILEEFHAPATVFIITDYIGKSNDWDSHLGWIHFPHLNADEIDKLHQKGWEIGSHGKSHRCLAGLRTDEIRMELSRSKEILEKEFACKVRYFASPFGKINRRIVDSVRQCGYSGVCGFYPFRYKNGVRDRMELGRMAVYLTDSLSSIETKVRDGKGFRWQMIRQNLINFCSNATLMTNALK